MVSPPPPEAGRQDQLDRLAKPVWVLNDQAPADAFAM
jgi:hypothetical protein